MTLLKRLSSWFSDSSEMPVIADIEETRLPNISTSLMADVFSCVPAQRPLVVLDFAAGNSSTVAFLNHFNCRVTFIDLLGVLADIEDAEALKREADGDFVSFSKEQLVGHYTKHLDNYSVSEVDICLFWDLLNFLPAEHFCALIEALQPRLHPFTCGHIIGAYNPRTAINSARFGLKELNSIEQRPLTLPANVRLHLYKQGELEHLLKPLVIDRSRLLGEGRVEYLLYHRDKS